MFKARELIHGTKQQQQQRQQQQQLTTHLPNNNNNKNNENHHLDQQQQTNKRWCRDNEYTDDDVEYCKPFLRTSVWTGRY